MQADEKKMLIKMLRVRKERENALVHAASRHLSGEKNFNNS